MKKIFDIKKMGALALGLVAFAPAADNNTTTIEETPIVEKSNEPQSEFDDEINSALQRLGIDLKDLSDFYAFK